MTIKKAVILAAREEDNLFPITKTIPKTMLPVLEKPTISYIVEEAFESGIEEIVIVVGKNDYILENYFKDYKNVFLVQQEDFLGSAYALKKTEFFLKEENFALLLGDEITFSEKPCLKQLIDIFNINNVGFVAAIEKVGIDKIRDYNFIHYEKTGNEKVVKINEVIEKPNKDIDTDVTSIGRYVISKEIFDTLGDFLEEQKNKVNDKFYLTSLLSSLSRNKNSLGVFCDSDRYHIHTVNDWLIANVEMFNKKMIN